MEKKRNDLFEVVQFEFKKYLFLVILSASSVLDRFLCPWFTVLGEPGASVLSEPETSVLIVPGPSVLGDPGASVLAKWSASILMELGTSVPGELGASVRSRICRDTVLISVIILGLDLLSSSSLLSLKQPLILSNIT